MPAAPYANHRSHHSGTVLALSKATQRTLCIGDGLHVTDGDQTSKMCQSVDFSPGSWFLRT